MARSTLPRRWRWVGSMVFSVIVPAVGVAQGPENLPPPDQLPAAVAPMQARPFPGRPDEQSGRVRPEVLGRPLESPPSAATPSHGSEIDPLFTSEIDPPLGFTGHSGIVPRDVQQNSHFVP